jgi:hypothetical protein
MVIDLATNLATNSGKLRWALRSWSIQTSSSQSAPPNVPGIAVGQAGVSSIVVMADDVWNVLVGHDAVDRSGPEHNARHNPTNARQTRHKRAAV